MSFCYEVYPNYLKRKTCVTERKGLNPDGDILLTTAQHLMLLRGVRPAKHNLHWRSMYLVNPSESKVSGSRVIGYSAQCFVYSLR
jgi:hypothetical protein